MMGSLVEVGSLVLHAWLPAGLLFSFLACIVVNGYFVLFLLFIFYRPYPPYFGPGRY